MFTLQQWFPKNGNPWYSPQKKARKAKGEQHAKSVSIKSVVLKCTDIAKQIANHPYSFPGRQLTWIWLRFSTLHLPYLKTPSWGSGTLRTSWQRSMAPSVSCRLSCLQTLEHIIPFSDLTLNICFLSSMGKGVISIHSQVKWLCRCFPSVSIQVVPDWTSFSEI